MRPDKLEKLQLTHQGKFSERCSGIFSILLSERGDVDIAMGLGMAGDGKNVGVLIDINDGKFSTAFTAKEAKAVAEILESTMKEEEPPTRKLREMFEHIISGCLDLAAQASELQRMRVERKLN
jgi:hypothetical protein